MPVNILGVARFHDVGAAVFSNGSLNVVAEAERVLDHKHARGPMSLPPAVNAALLSANVAPEEVTAVVVADTHGEGIECRPGWDLNSLVRGHEAIDPDVLPHTHGGRLLVQLGTVSQPHRLGLGPLRVDGLRPDTPVFGVCHHGAHAASAIYMSGFSECAALVVDGYGVCSGTVAYRYAENCCERVETLRDRALLGWRYSLFGHLTKEIQPGTDNLDLAGKVMGLNAYGTPIPRLVKGLTAWFRRDYRDYLETFDHNRRWFNDLLENAGIGRGEGSVEDPHFLDLIASMQEAFSLCMVDLAKDILRISGQHSLVLAGGCALNVLANTRIAELREVKDLFVIPSSGDGGLPMGAAVIGASTFLGAPLHMPDVSMSHRRNPYLGLPLALDSLVAPPHIRHEPMPADHATTASTIADRLASREVIGLAIGRCELGPRALGHRSILASGVDPAMRDLLNRIKMREWWRPFAPVCRGPDAARYFEGPLFSEYMLTAVKVREPYRSAFSAAAHEDGTARLQIIPDRDSNPLLWDIMSAFAQRTGIGVLINTSFNLGGKPLLNKASTAIAMVADGKIDGAWVEGTMFSACRSMRDLR